MSLVWEMVWRWQASNRFTCEAGPSASFCSSELPDGPGTFCRQSSEYEIDPFGRDQILLGETLHESEQLPTEKSISLEVCRLPPKKYLNVSSILFYALAWKVRRWWR
jgi:hypothetical protein